MTCEGEKVDGKFDSENCETFDMLIFYFELHVDIIWILSTLNLSLGKKAPGNPHQNITLSIPKRSHSNPPIPPEINRKTQ